MGGDAEDEKLDETDTEDPAGTVVEVFAVGELVDPMIEEVQMPQGGEDDVVEEGGIWPGEGGLADFVIKKVDGEAGAFLPGFEDFDGEAADVHKRGRGGGQGAGFSWAEAEETGAGDKPRYGNLGKEEFGARSLF
jgi:hypothetical protein